MTHTPGTSGTSDASGTSETTDVTPGLDPTVAARLAAATRAIPGVRDAAVVVRQGARTLDGDGDRDGSGNGPTPAPAEPPPA
ncbi:hypothetical protein, partial [Streptomyces brasiliscabiei]|uniref:hypothetical protein n=1 Tax=Streptomyces brasiliscabiei TaxID=2736302 RepID=UPI001C1148E6